ncbi:hypothetical protein B0T20DRAFT_358211 [Sordaria brevicollis]|uniref:Uncharacterized protein n=1 Tax=Sordaria brevicollis TaxID=83679 RepID=A0AAE0PA94_SORBR|nr:hypothetical protein B0T20DRAFT_358211 [Sordaria brevicollis]
MGGPPEDTVRYLAHSLQQFQFKYQARLPGSPDGTYNIRIQHSPSPQEYRTLRAYAGLPPIPPMSDETRPFRPEHMYCCTVTFKPSSEFLDQELMPVFGPTTTRVSSGCVKVETDSSSIKPEANADAKPCDSDSHREVNNEETTHNRYEIAELHVAPWHEGQGLEDVILDYFLDVASLFNAYFPALSEDETKVLEPSVTVKARDDFDMKFYASKGFVKNDTDKNNSPRDMILERGVIRALAKKRREDEKKNEPRPTKSRVEEWDDNYIWTKGRKAYEEILEVEGLLEKLRPKIPAEQGEGQLEDMLEDLSDIIQSIEMAEEVLNDKDVTRMIEEPEADMSCGMASFSEDIPGRDGKEKRVLPVRQRSGTCTVIDERKNVVRVKAERLSRMSRSSSI